MLTVAKALLRGPAAVDGGGAGGRQGAQFLSPHGALEALSSRRYWTTVGVVILAVIYSARSSWGCSRAAAFDALGNLWLEVSEAGPPLNGRAQAVAQARPSGTGARRSPKPDRGATADPGPSPKPERGNGGARVVAQAELIAQSELTARAELASRAGSQPGVRRR